MIKFRHADQKIELSVGETWSAPSGGDTYRDAEAFELQAIVKEIESGMPWREAVSHRFAAANPWLHQIVVSPKRDLFFRQYPLSDGAKVIDIGAGWGQASLPLAQRAEVTSLEPTPERLAFIRAAAIQLKVASQMHFLQTDFFEVEFESQFDLACCIGVLEWVPKFRQGDPRRLQVEFLKRIHSLLKPGGQFVLGIENRVGLKYLLGADDDHIGTPGVAIYDMDLAARKWLKLSGKALRSFTYTRSELEELLNEAGFHSTTFYVALPDYKVPEVIIPLGPATEAYFADDPHIPEHHGSDGRPLPDELQEGLCSHYRSLARMGIAGDFAPSYFVVGLHDHFVRPSSEKILYLLRQARKIDSTDGVMLDLYPANVRRKDYGEKWVYKVVRDNQVLFHLTVAASGLRSVYERAKAFAQNCPEVACQPLFFFEEEESSLQLFGQEYFDGETLDVAAARGACDAEQWNAAASTALANLDKSVFASSLEAYQREINELQNGVLSIETFSVFDKQLFQDWIFPVIFEEGRKFPIHSRWTNGDFYGANILRNPQGEIRLIDYEFAYITHFFKTDSIRLRELSVLPPKWDNFSLTHPRENIPTEELHFWLRHLQMLHTVIRPQFFLPDLPMMMERILTLACQIRQDRSQIQVGWSTARKQAQSVTSERDLLLANRDNASCEEQEGLAERDKEVSELRAELANRDKAICELQKEFTERDEAASELRAKLASRDKAICELQEGLAERDGAVSELRDELANRDAAICELAKESAELRLGVAEAEQKVGQLKASLSWRIAWPLRMVRDRLEAVVWRARRVFADRAAKGISMLGNSETATVEPFREESLCPGCNPDAVVSNGSPFEHECAGWWKEGLKHPLFDPSWYLQEYTDVAQAGVEPFQHYIKNGWREGRSPHPLFDPSWYLQEYTDVAQTEVEPFQHYFTKGWREGRRPHPLFDPPWYLQMYPDVVQAEVEPFQHYLTNGRREGRRPHPLFDPSWYLQKYPDVAQAEVEPFQHYITKGWREGRSPHPLFDPSWYLQMYPDVGQAEVEPFQHYLTKGWREGRRPHPLFNPTWYLQEYPDVGQAETEPFQHYLTKGWREGRRPHPLFDPSWYLQGNPDVGQAKAEPFQHYITEGWREGRSPHPLFDPTWYLQENPEVGQAEVEPFQHYVTKGWREGRNPYPLFDPTWYLQEYPDIGQAEAEPFQHYLTKGWREGRSPHPLFDPSWYLQEYSDVAQAEVEPFQHYVTTGWREGRSPHPLFDVRYYVSQSPKLGGMDGEPLSDFLRHGALAGLRPNSLFDPVWYAAFNQGSMSLGENPLTHYVTRGWKDGCDPHPSFNISLYLKANPEVRSRNEDPLAHYLHRRRDEWIHLMPKIPSEPHDPGTGSLQVDVKAIALYLPQFHPVMENDEWWGQGFTEWTNVRRGAPQYWDHYQPHIPHPDIGYYDLNDASVMEKQAQMARQSGIYGFCFYYYWFSGRRLLNMPTDRLLSSGQPDFPFCFCWANENWTRRWDGEEREVLIGQEHSRESDERFIRDILPALRDRRYIRINGRPLIAVYRPGLLPDPKATFIHWREFCRREGIGDIYLASFKTSFDLLGPEKLGVDAMVEFPPHQSEVTKSNREEFPVFNDFRGEIYDYRKLADNLPTQVAGDYKVFRGVMPSWDNTARMHNQGTIWAHSNPQLYCRWLHRAVLQTRRNKNPDERLIFINSWNEWAEGAHLEPDERHGYAWLNATRVALEAGSGGNSNEQLELEHGCNATLPCAIASPRGENRDACP